MFYRVYIIIFFGGVALTIFGFKEFKVGNSSTGSAANIELRSIEAGTTPKNNHLRIGQHVAVYSESVFQYTERKGSSTQVTVNTPINFAYYPIISASPPARGGRPAEQTTQSFAVLVKSERFAKVGSIPDSDRMETSIQGLVINQIQSLGAEERALLRTSFPATNFSKVLILEVGRKPSSAIGAIAMMIAGGGICLGSVLLAVWNVKADSRPEVSIREQYNLSSSNEGAGNFDFLNPSQQGHSSPATHASQSPIAMPAGSKPPVRGQQRPAPAPAPAPQMGPQPICCPHCHFAVAMNPAMRGMAVACPQCMQPFVMP